MNKPVLITGSLVTAALVGALFAGLGHDPREIDSPLIGKSAPSFALKTVGTGEVLDVTDFRGTPLVVNFWATWCRPCWEEQPLLTSGARALNGRVQFVGVVFQDEESKIQDFLNQRGSAYPTLIDEGGKTAIAYGVGGVPETFFIDKSGRIVAKYAGPLTPELLEKYVAEVTAK